MSITIIFLLCIFHLFIYQTVSLRYCCRGVIYSNPAFPSQIQQVDCGTINNAEIGCVTMSLSNLTYYDCATTVLPEESNGTRPPYTQNQNESYLQYPYCDPKYKCCTSGEYCNCDSKVHKTTTQVQNIGGQMRQIMYPIMGVIFGIVWVACAAVANLLNLHLVLMVNGFVTALFGIFLILLPVTTYLGLLYIAVGSFAVAVIRGGGDKAALRAVGVVSLIVFLLTGGLTLVALDNNTNLGPYMDRLLNTVGQCDSSMDIVVVNNEYFNLSIRCENYLLLTCFCVFLLFLLQPFTIMASFLASVIDAKDVGKPPNQL
eukprot:TRINITY_DN705_c0_g1_i1.p1 TRINITY_DN705_c0_g1~~TRINITY_DN705_c0_g1_i1.p1  ORF type:complete len:356 (-),score=36.19 TRINITY_DN705_c0_g1_i1:143-1090(-)